MRGLVPFIAASMMMSLGPSFQTGPQALALSSGPSQSADEVADLAQAFEAAWGGTVGTWGHSTFLAMFSTLHHIEGHRYALVSDGGSMDMFAHHILRDVAIREVIWTPTGFAPALGHRPAYVSGWTFGTVTRSVRDDVMPNPVVVVAFPSGGDWISVPSDIGVRLIEMTLDGPVVRTGKIPLSCAADPRSSNNRISGEILPASDHDSFTVRYTGNLERSVTYRLDDTGSYLPLEPITSAEWCGPRVDTRP